MHTWSCLSGSDNHLIIIKRYPSAKHWFIANYGSTSQGNHGLFRQSTCQSGWWWDSRNGRRSFPSFPRHHRRRQVLSSFHASVWPPVCLSVSNDVTTLTQYGLQVSALKLLHIMKQNAIWNAMLGYFFAFVSRGDKNRTWQMYSYGWRYNKHSTK